MDYSRVHFQSHIRPVEKSMLRNINPQPSTSKHVIRDVSWFGEDRNLLCIENRIVQKKSRKSCLRKQKLNFPKSIRKTFTKETKQKNRNREAPRAGKHRSTNPWQREKKEQWNHQFQRRTAYLFPRSHKSMNGWRKVRTKLKPNAFIMLHISLQTKINNSIPETSKWAHTVRTVWQGPDGVTGVSNDRPSVTVITRHVSKNFTSSF